MKSQGAAADRFFKHEGFASSIAGLAWLALDTLLDIDDAVADAVMFGMMAVILIRILYWHRLGFWRYLGIDGDSSEEFGSVDEYGVEAPMLTAPERTSFWAVPAGYGIVWCLGLDLILAHAFAGGVAAAIAVGVLYRLALGVDLPLPRSGS